MSKKLLKPLFIICILAAIIGCGGGNSINTANGTGQIKISLVDAPLDADEINVEIINIQVHSSDSGWTTLNTFNPALRVNLLDYSTSGNSLLLADSPLKAGYYTMVRLMISSAEIVINGQPYQVNTKNIAQTGIKCNGEFKVADNQLMALILDFNAGKSFVNNPPGSNNFKLHPVMTMSPVNLATEVTGRVEVKDADGNTVAIPEGTVVDVYAAGYIGDPNYLVSGAIVEPDGYFRISVLQQGIYDFQVTADAGTAQLISVLVTAPATDLGTITVQLP